VTDILRSLVEWRDSIGPLDEQVLTDIQVIIDLETIVERARAAITSPNWNMQADIDPPEEPDERVMESYRAAFKGSKEH
jgi:hypothetical protein